MPQTRRLSLAAAAVALAAGGIVVVLGAPETGSFVAASGVTGEVDPRASPEPTATTDALSPLPRALVAVSVAEVWSHHRKVRQFDGPALKRPAHIAAWIHGMSFYQRSHLYQRLATQVRYGEVVEVLGTRGSLTRIRIPDQTGGRFPDGIIGWIASRQLTAASEDWATTATVATVVTKRAALDRTIGGTTRALTVSYGTTLPVVAVHAGRVVVAVPGASSTGWLPRDAVRIHAPGEAAIPFSAHQVVAQAKRFLGLPYLWAGMTAWGYDCSGLTSTIFGVLGVTLARDAADQSLAGKAVARRDLRPGDLVFFSHTRKRGDIHHVAIYAGHGRLLQSPYTGARVELVKLRHSYLNREYWGATRVVPSH